MKEKQLEIKWGQIYYCNLNSNLGSEQNGIRPVMVLQTNKLNNKSNTTIVAAISTADKKDYLSSHVVLDKKCGLTKRSIVMLEQMYTIDVNDRLLNYVGQVTDKETIAKIKESLLYVYGLANPNWKKDVYIESVCNKCRSKYFSKNNYILRRLNPEEKALFKCDRCKKEDGHKYIVIKGSKYGKE